MLCMNLWACAIKTTLQIAKVHTNSVTLCPWESLEYLNHFVSAKPSVPCAEISWPVLDFWCYSLQTKTTNIELSE